MGYLNDIKKQESIRNEIRYTRDNFNGSRMAQTLRYIEAMSQYKYSSDITLYFDSLEELDKDGYMRVRKVLTLESLSNITVVSHPVCEDDNIVDASDPMLEASGEDDSTRLKDLIRKMKGDK